MICSIHCKPLVSATVEQTEHIITEKATCEIRAYLRAQNNGDEEDGCTGLSSSRHYLCILLFALCMLSTLCVINQYLF